MKSPLLAVIVGLIFCACSSQKQQVDLHIKNVTILNFETNQQQTAMDVFIDDGVIVGLGSTLTGSDFEAESVIEGNGRLLTPGFIDVHNHLNFVFEQSEPITNPDEFERYRRMLAESYLPFGVTAVRSAGGRESDLDMMMSWTKRDAHFPDYYPVGGALVSLNTGFYNHAFVPDTSAVRQKLTEYHSKGIRHIKLYSLIDEEKAAAAIQFASAHDMKVFGHIENTMISVNRTLDLGMKDYEHAKTAFLEAINQYAADGRDLSMLPPDDDENWVFREYEVFNLLTENDPLIDALVERFKNEGASLTPTLHLYAEPVGLTYFKANESELSAADSWSEEKMNRAREGYHHLAALVVKMHNAGIRIQLGSDTFQPGKAMLSEILLLHEAGIAMMDLIEMATINGAEAIGVESEMGMVETGKRANLILFEENPMENAEALIGKKTVLKDGVVYTN